VHKNQHSIRWPFSQLNGSMTAPKTGLPVKKAAQSDALAGTGDNESNISKSLLALDIFSLFLAPVRGGAGPYLAFYFASHRHWTAGSIGMLLGTMALCFAISQIPAGMLIDKIGRPREIGAAALAILAFAMLVMLLVPSVPVVLVAQAMIGLGCAFFTPVVALLSLNLVGYNQLNLRLGRNEVFCHIGNIITGVLLGVGMQKLGGDLILTLLMGACVVGMIAVMCIRARDLNNSDTPPSPKEPPHLLAGFKSLLTVKGARPFSISSALFFFSNAAMLPLMIQLISRQGQNASVRLPAALLLAELVMIPVCALAGRKANWGRKPLILVAFVLLAARGICFSMIKDANILVGVQVLDGISAGIFSLLLTLVVADLSRAKGNLNSMLCALMMMLTMINAMSDFVCGTMANHFGFSTAFGMMAGVAILGAVIFMIFVPETAPKRVLGGGEA
jgi:MFS family permease